MIENWGAAATALREELSQYGRLLNLFDEQQNLILRRDPEGVLDVTDKIDQHLEIVRQTRRQREDIVRDLVQEAGFYSDAPLTQHVTCFPEPVQPMFKALIAEINRLLTHTRRRAGQNRALLARAVELSEQLLQRMRPDRMTKTYSNRGRLRLDISKVEARQVVHG